MKKNILLLLMVSAFGFAQKKLSKDYSYTVSEPFTEYKGLSEDVQIKQKITLIKLMVVISVQKNVIQLNLFLHNNL